jgi:tetratricopeptide (TPR) repeat protein
MTFESSFSEGDPQIPRSLEKEWDRQLCLGRRPTAPNIPEVSDDERDCYRRAQELRKQGQRLKALRVYAEILQLQLPHFKKVAFSTSSDPIRYTAKLILGTLYEELPHQRLPDRMDEPCFTSFLEDRVNKLPEPDDVDTLYIIRSLADYMTMDYCNGPRLAQRLYNRVLRQIENAPGHDPHEEMHIVQELAKLYVDQRLLVPASKERLAWSEQETIIHRGLAEMEKKLGRDHPDIARFCYELGMLYLCQNMELDAERLLERAYTTQKRMLGERHEDTIASMKSLREFYVDQEQFVKAEALMRAAVVMEDISETSATTGNDQFSSWFRSESFQGKLASLCTPGGNFYWEDSRIYLQPLRQIALTPAFPLDPFPRAPAKVMILGDKLDIQISHRDLCNVSGTKYDADTRMVDEIRATKIYHFLEFKAKKKDWTIFRSKKNKSLTVEQGPSEDRYRGDYSCPEDPLSSSSDRPIFWIFTDDQEGIDGDHYLVSPS